jgi:hypothetical protein
VAVVTEDRIFPALKQIIGAVKDVSEPVSKHKRAPEKLRVRVRASWTLICQDWPSTSMVATPTIRAYPPRLPLAPIIRTKVAAEAAVHMYTSDYRIEVHPRLSQHCSCSTKSSCTTPIPTQLNVSVNAPGSIGLSFTAKGLGYMPVSKKFEFEASPVQLPNSYEGDGDRKLNWAPAMCAVVSG